ncbi:MAG: AAA family ATPase [Defluviitaleaceae bacterium]|nr:AAA family ATPase [Defluviitaleaceae bacterium]
MSKERQTQLNRIVIKGYKSIKDSDIELGNLNVLIGSNGAGKSNFMSIFPLFQNIVVQNLARYAGIKGVNSLFHNGTKVTDSVLIEFHFDSYIYAFELEASENNSLIFCEERIEAGGLTWGDGGHNESKWEEGYLTLNLDRDDIRALSRETIPLYHFNDTGSTSKIKREHNLSNSNILMRDASNLATFLYRLRKYYEAEYQKIVKAVQRIAPYFKDFILKPEEDNSELIFLRWQEKDCDEIFNPSQLSDGTLRFICLATLLLQPAELQPAIIIIDEPELGLHPYAITILAELVKKAATRKQVILATQSVELLDHFEAEDVIVVDRSPSGSEFKRLDAERLAAWLEDDYTLGELWNKNLFGGRVAR